MSVDLRFTIAKSKQGHRTLTGVQRSDRAPVSANAKLSATQDRGIALEEIAIEHLQSHGLYLLMRNINSYFGEIDAVMQEGACVVFVEVRSRRHNHYGGSIASIDRNKQKRLYKTAQHFLPLISQRYFAGITPLCRFDAVCFDGLNQELSWYRNIQIDPPSVYSY